MIDDNNLKDLTILSSILRYIVPTSGLTTRTLTHHRLQSIYLSRKSLDPPCEVLLLNVNLYELIFALSYTRRVPMLDPYVGFKVERRIK
jgi:hypothetical protein